MARWAIRSARSQLSRNREEVERQHENYNVMLYGATEKSERRPGLINDDAFFIDKSTGALGVFDGVGGAEGSDVASATAAHSVEQFLRDIPYNQNRSSADKYVVEAAVRAHHAILDRQQTDEPIQTTATIAKVFLDTQTNQPFVSIASVGDSRAYLYRNGHLEAITIDQGIYFGTGEDDQRRMQAVLSEVDDPADLTTQEEYDAFRYRHTIVGALGGYDHNPPVTSLDIDVQKGDRIILTTDGIHDNLTTSELQRHLLLVRDDSAVAAQLIAAAQARSRDSYHLRAKPDDMTVAIMTID